MIEMDKRMAKTEKLRRERTTEGLKWGVTLCVITLTAQHWGRIKDKTSNFLLLVTAGGRDTDRDDSSEAVRFSSSLVECVHAWASVFVCMSVCVCVTCVFRHACNIQHVCLHTLVWSLLPKKRLIKDTTSAVKNWHKTILLFRALCLHASKKQ